MSGHWQEQREGGGRRALRLIRFIALYGGRPLARLCLYPATLYFYLRRADERAASRDYLARLTGRPATLRQVFEHFHCFAAVLLDRIFLLARGERGFAFEVEGVEELERRIAGGRGVLLVGSHQGSFEALRVLGTRRPDLPMRIVLDRSKTPELTAMFDALAPDLARSVVDISQGGAAATMALAGACREGAMVALLADRGRGHETLRHAPFLGAPAPFPVGPWLLAQALGAPVMLCFGLYLGGNRYRLVFEPFEERVVIPRERRERREAALDALLARYAARLEHHARALPCNWFNFYDFWRQDERAPSVPGSRAAAPEQSATSGG